MQRSYLNKIFARRYFLEIFDQFKITGNRKKSFINQKTILRLLSKKSRNKMALISMRNDDFCEEIYKTLNFAICTDLRHLHSIRGWRVNLHILFLNRLKSIFDASDPIAYRFDNF